MAAALLKVVPLPEHGIDAGAYFCVDEALPLRAPVRAINVPFVDLAGIEPLSITRRGLDVEPRRFLLDVRIHFILPKLLGQRCSARESR